MPIIVLKGYPSQTYVDNIARSVSADVRPAVLLYGGDFEPTGEDIERDLAERTGFVFDEIVRVALTRDQIDTYNLPPQPGKTTDTRAGRFMAEHGEQVELDALGPDTLQDDLYLDRFADYWDEDTDLDALDRENDERELLEQLADEFEQLQADRGTS